MFAVIVNNHYSGISGKVGFTIEDKTSIPGVPTVWQSRFTKLI
jgi:hypothetical protein